MHLLVATRNKGKADEFRHMLAGDRVQFDDLANRNDGFDVDETGRTFRENACLKASAYAKRYNVHALADDSGLVVDMLGGAPGVYSARFAAMHDAGSGDEDNNNLLLRKLANIPDEKRTARFECVLALAGPDGRVILTAAGTVEGRILRERRGTNGFGYDPLFLLPDRGVTTAELSPAEKHAISHRGQALRRLKALMSRVGML